MMFDDILERLGEFGRFQRMTYLIVCIMIFTTSWDDYIVVFLGATVDHRCAVSEWSSNHCSSYGLTYDECKVSKKEASIPFNSTGEMIYAQCLKYNVSGVDFIPGMDPSNYSTEMLSTIQCDQGWVYDDSQYKSTIVTDFDLVCEREDLNEIAQTVYYAGYLVGSIVFGVLSDGIGRRWTLGICTTQRVLTSVALSFAPNWWIFTLLRFFQGMANISSYIILFILGTEYVGPSKRNIAGILLCIPYALGYMFLALLAYWLKYWRTLQLAVAVPLTFLIAIMMILPESARWLISNGKYDQAKKLVKTIAKVNKKSVPDPLFTEEFKMEQNAVREESKPSAVDLFRTPKVCFRTINLSFNWMAHSLIYTGLSLNTSNLGVNDYVAFAIAGAVEIPAYAITIFTVEYFGRRPSLIVLVMLGGVACLCTALVPAGVWLTTVAMIGKFGISGSFGILYLYTAELYPTNIRTIAVGTCSMFSRVATMLAPLILTLGKLWTSLPLVIFGSVAVIAGFLTIFLPETRGYALPETRQEGEDIGKDSPDNRSHSEMTVYSPKQSPSVVL